jgi:hypothetical protein
VVPFINFNEEQEQRLYGDAEMLSLVLARTWGILPQPLPQIIQERNRQRDRGPAGAQEDIMTAALVQALEQTDPTNPLIQEWRRQQQQLSTSPGENAIQRVRALLGPVAPAPNANTPRQLIEHIAVLDTLHTTSIDDVCDWLRGMGDEDGASRLEQAAVCAREALGIWNLRIISDFPIALCAVGYTRITRDPTRSILSPFETSDPQGRTPLYVVTAETEGIYLQLDPVRVVTWLIDNAWYQSPPPVNADEAWAWLYRNIPGLWQNRWQANYNDALAVAVRTLLHTISHVLLRHVEWSGFNQNSVGEYLLALGSICYRGRLRACCMRTATRKQRSVG